MKSAQALQNVPFRSILLACLIRVTSQSGVVYYQSPLLAAAGVPHAFSTRLGGLSPPPFDSMNMGNPNGCAVQDLPERIEANYRLLQEAIGAGERRVLRVHQVHAAAVEIAWPDKPWDNSRKADAIIATAPEHLASVRIADCVPVLLAVEDGSAVAAVHAGWRGVVGGVLPNALKELRKLRPSMPVIAAIGPCITFDAFEVGPEVLAEFQAVFGNDAPLRHRAHGKGFVDLRKSLAIQLEASGVSPRHIDVSDRCTFRDADEFFSHRRDNGITGRMTALIGVKK